MKKEIIFQSKFDTSDFDRAVESMQKKLKEIYAPADMVRHQTQTAQKLQQMGMGGMMSKPSQQEFQRATQQSRREMDAMIKEQVQGNEKLGKLIAQRTDKLKEMKNQYQEHLKFVKEDLDLKTKIGRVEENNARLRENYRGRQEALDQLFKARESLRPPGIAGVVQGYKEGGLRGAMGALGGGGNGMFGPAGLIGGVGTAVSGLATAGQVGSDIYKYLGRAPIEAGAAMGRATSGTFGRELEGVYAGRSPFENAYLPEKARAAQRAMEATRRVQQTQFLDVGLGITKAAGAGMAGGAAGGAALGSVFPGVGTAIGAGLGGAGGAIGGAAYGMMGALGDPMKRATLLSPFSKTADQHRQALLAENFASNFMEALDSEKNQNPLKRLAAEEYQQTFMRNLQFQRSTGLDNQSFRGQGGFMERAINAGFTPEMAMEMSQGILGAGGSTRASQQSAFGLQMQRGMGLNNAGQILGTLSGGMGGAEATKQATIRVLAEGMRLGLDSSDFVEENRRFTQAAADIVARSGARTEEDAGAAARGFGRFVAEPTNRGLEAAKTAYEQFQQATSAVTGPRGVMRAAGFLKDPLLRGLGTVGIQSLMQIPENEINSGNIMVQGAAATLGVPVEKVIESMKGVNERSISRFAEADQIRDKLRKKGVDIGRIKPEEYNKLPMDVQRDLFRLTSLQTTEYGYKGTRETQAFAAGVVGAPEQYGPGVGPQAVEARLGGPTGRVEDETVRGLAEGSRLMLTTFNKLKDQIAPTAEAVATFNTRLQETVDIINKMPEAQKAGMFAKLFSGLVGAPAKSENQSQSTKPTK